jgi:hypothetical protein
MLRYLILLALCLACTYGVAETAKSPIKPANVVIDSKDYTLGAGDLVRISVYGSPDMLTEARFQAWELLRFRLLARLNLAVLVQKPPRIKLLNCSKKMVFLKKRKSMCWSRNIKVNQFQYLVMSTNLVNTL